MGRRGRIPAQRHGATDLAAALAANPPMAQAFDTLNKTQQYALILKLVTAQTTDARAAQLHKALIVLKSRGA